MSDKRDIYENRTARETSRDDSKNIRRDAKNIQRDAKDGPLAPADADFPSQQQRRSPEFSGTPGAGANPAGLDTEAPMPPPPLKPK